MPLQPSCPLSPPTQCPTICQSVCGRPTGFDRSCSPPPVEAHPALTSEFSDPNGKIKGSQILFGKKFIVFQRVWLPDRIYKSFQHTNISVRFPL